MGGWGIGPPPLLSLLRSWSSQKSGGGVVFLATTPFATPLPLAVACRPTGIYPWGAWGFWRDWIDKTENKDILLGRLVEAVGELQKDVSDIKKRLEEGDKDLVILRFSRCLLGTLDKYGLVKCLLIAAISAATGYSLAT